MLLCIKLWRLSGYIIPRTTKFGGVYWFHSVSLSIRPSCILCLLCSTFSYLYILSSNFRRCVACKGSCKFQNLNFWQFFKICNFDFVLFLLGIWCESLVWVIMGQRGVSQNAGILVVLVLIVFKSISTWNEIPYGSIHMSENMRECTVGYEGNCLDLCGFWSGVWDWCIIFIHACWELKFLWDSFKPLFIYPIGLISIISAE